MASRRTKTEGQTSGQAQFSGTVLGQVAQVGEVLLVLHLQAHPGGALGCCVSNRVCCNLCGDIDRVRSFLRHLVCGGVHCVLC